jgi:hypothetical protein
MPTELLSRDLVHTVDAIELPPVGNAIDGRSERRDSYPIVVTRSPEDTVERLLQLVGDANVAVITDDNVAKLYGALVIGALKKAGIETEVAAVRAGEKHKTLHQACELLDWLTGTQKPPSSRARCWPSTAASSRVRVPGGCASWPFSQRSSLRSPWLALPRQPPRSTARRGTSDA